MDSTLSTACNGSCRRLYGLLREGIVTFALLISSVTAQAWPDRIVRIVTPTGAGGGSDTIARTFAEIFSKRWGQAVVVENKPGADGIIGVSSFVNLHDDHTLLFAISAVATVHAVQNEKLP